MVTPNVVQNAEALKMKQSTIVISGNHQADTTPITRVPEMTTASYTPKKQVCSVIMDAQKMDANELPLLYPGMDYRRVISLWG